MSGNKAIQMPPYLAEFKGKRVLVMGLGLFGGGVGVVRFLHREGARITVTDLREAEDLKESLAALEQIPVDYKLGGHDAADFTSSDLIVANPAVPRSSPFLAAAAEAGVPVTTEICLFVSRCRAGVVGVTGTSGKTTTASLIGEMLRRLVPQTLVGGNIGGSLLDHLGGIEPYTPVVLELSSFQLDYLADLRWSPGMAVVTNFAPNHLDMHGSLEAYRSAKQSIVEFQGPSDNAVLNVDDDEVWAWRDRGEGIVRPFSMRKRAEGGVYVDGDRIVSDLLGEATPLCGVEDVALLGRHNLSNALAATCTGLAKGVPDAFAVEVLQAFQGVEHRLERVAQAKGVTFYNDSIATSPDRTTAALEALSGRVVLIAGGYDKGLAYDDLGSVIDRRASGLVLIGKTADKIAASLPAGSSLEIRKAGSLKAAVREAQSLAGAEGVVLFSPASASYDMFRNFQERGDRFKEIVLGMVKA